MTSIGHTRWATACAAACVVFLCLSGRVDASVVNDAQGLCGAMKTVQSAVRPQASEPSFMPSYRTVREDVDSLPAALRETAFVYDNALAAMAFIACGDTQAARAIGDAFVAASAEDRHYRDGRLRNAYRAGPVAKPPLLPGFWDDDAGRWMEDEYQASTAVGNVAWAALALLQLHRQTGDPSYLDTALRLGRWLEQFVDPSGSGLTGGYYGFEPKPARISWKSTEHNIDVVAVGRWLWSETQDPRWTALSESALSFLTVMQDSRAGFFIGTDGKGSAASNAGTVLDAQVWPLMVLPKQDRPAAWEGSIARIDELLGVPGGYDFNGDRDGMWVEGTSQMALLFALESENERADALIASVMENRDAKSGWLFATRENQISTGLTIDAAGQGEEFRYYRWPHLGATAWAVLAITRFNPFRPNEPSEIR
ncbi:hypothetical protein [Ensifer sp. MJa1]|uniref:hypothetical protein n=1 Tax=Ensifer sp. MJa1 TaxID=2919888 RepID=UPI0030081D46